MQVNIVAPIFSELCCGNPEACISTVPCVNFRVITKDEMCTKLGLVASDDTPNITLRTKLSLTESSYDNSILHGARQNIRYIIITVRKDYPVSKYVDVISYQIDGDKLIYHVNNAGMMAKPLPSADNYGAAVEILKPLIGNLIDNMIKSKPELINKYAKIVADFNAQLAEVSREEVTAITDLTIENIKLKAQINEINSAGLSVISQLEEKDKTIAELTQKLTAIKSIISV